MLKSGKTKWVYGWIFEKIKHVTHTARQPFITEEPKVEEKLSRNDFWRSLIYSFTHTYECMHIHLYHYFKKESSILERLTRSLRILYQQRHWQITQKENEREQNERRLWDSKNSTWEIYWIKPLSGKHIPLLTEQGAWLRRQT